MAIKNIICKGIGFSPATLKWIPTHGYSIGAAVVLPGKSVQFYQLRAQRRDPIPVQGQNRDPVK